MKRILLVTMLLLWSQAALAADTQYALAILLIGTGGGIDQALGPDGHVFAADFYHDRVQKFRPDGTFLTAFGTPASGLAHSAIAVDVDADGTVYVANYDAHRVEKWQPRASEP